MQRGTNLPAIGSFNQTVVLERIRRAPDGISRAELASATGLSPQTASNVVKRLVDDGLVEEAGTLIQGRGKPPMILRLRPRSRYAVGVHLDPAFITYVVLDLSGTVVAHAYRRPPAPQDPEAVIAHIAHEIDGLISAAGIDRRRVLGLGVGVPGPIDAELGIVLGQRLLVGWRQVPLRDALAAATGLNVVFDKNINAFAAAELWIGDGARRNFVAMYFSTGVATGLVLEGNIFRGATGNAGDGGRIIVNESGVPRARTQQLGHLVTPEFLVEQAVDEEVLLPGGDLEEQFDRLLTEAAAGDPGAMGILYRAGRNIGSAVVTLVNLLDVPEIVFGGPSWEQIEPFALPVIEHVVQTSDLRSTRHRVAFSTSTVGIGTGAHVPAVGAACLVLDSALSPRASSLLLAESNLD